MKQAAEYHITKKSRNRYRCEIVFVGVDGFEPPTLCL